MTYNELCFSLYFQPSFITLFFLFNWEIVGPSSLHWKKLDDSAEVLVIYIHEWNH